MEFRILQDDWSILIHDESSRAGQKVKVHFRAKIFVFVESRKFKIRETTDVVSKCKKSQLSYVPIKP